MKPQLASTCDLDKLRYPMIAQIKYDGIRVIAHKIGDDIKLTTRNEHEFINTELAEAIRKLPYSNIMLDGELIVLDQTNDRESGRAKLAGKVNSSMKSGTDFSMDGLGYVIFDLPQSQGRQEDRTAQVENLLKGCEAPLQIAKSVDADDMEAVQRSYDYATYIGLEGLILKNPNGVYKSGRSKDWIKMKETKSAELICVCTEPGKKGTKYEAYIGSLLCTGTIGGREVSVSVGSGLTDADREVEPFFYHSKIIEVKYNAVIPSQSGNRDEWTLFLPRFVCVRLDK